MMAGTGESFPAFLQKASTHDDGLVCWDYHVVLVVEGGRIGREVWDPDTLIAFPCAFGEYLALTFPATIPPELLPRFRIMDADEYRAVLATDRSHMRSPDGSWRAPPPAWPPPGADRSSTPNLTELIDMERPSPGVVTDFEGFAEWGRR
jgi:hypothetical protein